jgi:phage tail-like protein
MRLLDLAATPRPEGNRIEVSWKLPPSPRFKRVRVVRREATHPTTPNPASAAAGIVVPEVEGRSSVLDTGLRGETVYYYSLYPYNSAGPVGPADKIVIDDRAEQEDPFNRTAAMATSPGGMSDEMYALLPSIYRRYDLRGVLRRFLDLPGGQLDQLYSHATAALRLLDLERVDGRLLPLLAEWIGWSTDYSLEISDQRNEIRHAPALYKATGLIPVIEATVQRIIRKRSRVKEFVHNVATTNRPERLNLWQRTRHGQAWGAAELLSLDASFGGRATVAVPGQEPPRMFHEQEEGGRSRVWSKELSATGWSGSEPFSEGSLSYKDPSATVQRGDPVVFWSAYDGARGRWTIESRTRRGGIWSAAETFVPPGGDAGTDRRKPVAVADATGIWLFWLERADAEAKSRWVLKYNRHDGTRWQLNPSADVPDQEAQPPTVLDDVFAVFHPTDQRQRLWLFWARQEPAPPPAPDPQDPRGPAPPAQDPTLPRQTRWTVAYRVKAGVDPAVSDDWGEVRTLPKAEDGDHDREPYALPAGDGNLEVFWSSHRGGRWSVWRNVLNRATHIWGTPERLSDSPHSARAPVAFSHGEDTVLVFRSSQSLRYPSKVYSATETVDARYTGTSTIHVRNAAVLAMRGTFDDIGTYISDAGRGGVRSNDDWYAPDTVGVYLPSDTADTQISRLSQVLREFMPATDRAVFIKEP